MKKTAIFVVSTILVIALAYIIGVEAGQFIKSRNESAYKSLRSKNTQLILKKMSSVNIGDKLPNYFFYDVDGNFVELKTIITSRTFVIFISYDCPACTDELELLNRMSSDTFNLPDLVFISNSNPFELMQLKKNMRFTIQILYDHERIYNAITRVASTPFNFLIDKEMVIEGIFPGQLLEDDVRGIAINSRRTKNAETQSTDE